MLKQLKYEINELNRQLSDFKDYNSLLNMKLIDLTTQVRELKCIREEFETLSQGKMSSEKIRCKEFKDYDYVVLVKNRRGYIYKRGKNIGENCRKFYFHYDFEKNAVKVGADYYDH